MVRVGHPVVREQHVVGVEVARRRELRVAVELDALAQLEGVAQAVGRGGPALGQAGDDVGRADLELDQPVVDRHRRRVGGRAGREELRVEALGAAFGAVDEGLGGEGGAGPASSAAAARPATASADDAVHAWSGVRRGRAPRSEPESSRAARRDDRSAAASSGRPAEAGVAILHRLGSVAQPGTAAAGRCPAGRERAQRGQPVGFAQGDAERRAHARRGRCWPTSAASAVDRRAQVPGADDRAEQRVAPAQQLRHDLGMGEVGAAEEQVVEAVDRAQQRGPAGVVEQAGEVAVERIERLLRRRARRTGAPCGRRPSRSGSRPCAESVSPPASKIGRSTTLAIARRRPWVPIIATARARSISPSSSSALERAGRAADDLGGEDDVASRSGWRRRPTNSPRRAASSSAAARRAARAAAGRRAACPRRSPRRAAPSAGSTTRRGRPRSRARRPPRRRPASRRSGRCGSSCRSSARPRRSTGAPSRGAPRGRRGDRPLRRRHGAVAAEARRGGLGRRAGRRASEPIPPTRPTTSSPQAPNRRQPEYRQRRLAGANVSGARISRWRAAPRSRAAR